MKSNWYVGIHYRGSAPHYYVMQGVVESTARRHYRSWVKYGDGNPSVGMVTLFEGLPYAGEKSRQVTSTVWSR